jgi:hypothetical protein
MNPMLMTAARLAAPHLLSMTRGRKRKLATRAGKWASEHVMRRHRRSVARMALSGLGAAAVAVPVGMWVGRKLMERGEADRVH